MCLEGWHLCGMLQDCRKESVSVWSPRQRPFCVWLAFVYKEAHAKAARVSFVEETTRFANICSMITFQLLFFVVDLKLLKVCAGVGEPAGTKLYRERSDSL